ncbi:MarR family winged helix-turn-helix transcriptional regulator [Neptunicella marina]|uniref:MarR family winged helix-turn-helix transcriptional regulator n=1 Tax=Neptunicella marina TaxID=2125989 RepID=UPI0019D5820C|nr:MarR family transcriptional regulator [Neptunicella marina]
MQQTDFLDELKELALGTRLKRLSEQMQADAAQVYAHFGMPIQPKWFSLLALLQRKKRVTVVHAAESLGLTQPAISQFSRDLQKQGLIDAQACDEDSRRRWLILTEEGKQAVENMQPAWDAVEAAARELSQAFENDLYLAIQKCEKALRQKSLFARTLEHHHAQQK